MFISENLVFIELHKTGCTHIGKLLSSNIKGQQLGKHNPPAPLLINSGKIFIGSIRNPWDWYVSLWAYGCNKKGLIYNLTTQTPASSNNSKKQREHSEKWKQCYINASDTGAFREWLGMIHNEEYWHDFAEGYGISGIAHLSGLMTFRYINLFCRHMKASANSHKDIRLYESENCFIDHFIKMENLAEDFISIMNRSGIKLNKNEKKKIRAAKKTNISSGRKETKYYYDESSIELVNKRDSLIIDKFQYPPP